jgi:hypothetical protein
LNGWLTAIKADIDAGYSPHAGALCFSPKPKWLLRKGYVLDLRDEVVLNAILADFYPQLWEALKWSQGSVDIAYQLKAPSADIAWMQSTLSGWREFNDKSMKYLSQGYSYVAPADITNFYDNIHLELLHSDLNAIHVNENLLEIAIRCLQRWATPNGKGIPQGFSGSDILSKLYMNVIDRRMVEEGYSYIRYVDDIRVFCKTKNAAKRALSDLIYLLAKKGLALHSGKTKILEAEAARKDYSGTIPLIDAINKRLAEEMHLDPYVNWVELEKTFKENPTVVPPEILELAFKEHVVENDGEFNKSVFRFLLTRLGRVKSMAAVDYCLHSLYQHPEEMNHVLKYFSDIGLSRELEKEIIKFLNSDDAIYEYQVYEIIKWFYLENRFSEEIMSVARRLAFDRNKTSWLRTYSLLILGENGMGADLERILECYQSATSQLEKAEIVAAISKMERNKRNAFYGQVKKDSDLVRRAIQVTKQISPQKHINNGK